MKLLKKTATPVPDTAPTRLGPTMLVNKQLSLHDFTFRYISPMTMRTRMAELFRDPTCKHWWLPNEEGLSPVLHDIRAFADTRNGRLVTHRAEALREISAIFSKMHIRNEDAPPT